MEKREDLQETEGQEEIRDLGKTGDPGKRGGGLFQGVKNFDLDPFGGVQLSL